MSKLDTRSTKTREIIDLRKYKFNSVQVLGRYKYNHRESKLKIHRHEGMLEICYLYSGSQNYVIGNDIFSLKGGDIIINGPDIPHGTKDFFEEKGTLYWLIVKCCNLNNLLNLNKKDSKTLISELESLSNSKLTGNKLMKKDLDMVFKAYRRNDHLTKIEMTHYLLSFILKVISLREKEQGNEVDLNLIKVKEYIRENIRENLQLEELADMCHWSLSHFKLKFKSSFGLPPGDYIQREKIKMAAELMSDSNQSINSIAYQLGFTAPSYFSTVFKKHTGLSPSEAKIKGSATLVL